MRRNKQTEGFDTLNCKRIMVIVVVAEWGLRVDLVYKIALKNQQLPGWQFKIVRIFRQNFHGVASVTTPPQSDIFFQKTAIAGANPGLEPNLMMVGAALEGCSLPFAMRRDGRVFPVLFKIERGTSQLLTCELIVSDRTGGVSFAKLLYQRIDHVSLL